MLHKARYFTVRGLQGQAVAATKSCLRPG